MKNLIPFLTAFLVVVIVSTAYGQVDVPVFGQQQVISGYHSALTGEAIPYFSVYPKYVKEALLTRCTDGKKEIEWMTDTIPANTKGKYAYFVWVSAHSTGTSGGVRHFDFYINDEFKFTFSTQPKSYPPTWSYASADSTRMVFAFVKEDAARDAHGMTYLRVPLSRYRKGQPLKLKITGQHQESNDWYMAFKYAFKPRLDITALPFILRHSAGDRQPVRITALHFGKPETLMVTLNQREKKQFAIQSGFNVLEFNVPAVSSPTRLAIEAAIGKQLKIARDIVLKPVIHREINLVHHSHTDIGYSHVQEEVIRIHTDNIRQALTLIEKTRNYPEGSRFIWNIESSWAVENFLRVASPAEKIKFIEAVKAGSIVISATYANVLTGLSTPEEMQWLVDYSVKLRDSLRFPIKTGMMSDIPGMSWNMVSVLAQNGVRYFSNGPNYVAGLPDKGDRIGHTLAQQGNNAIWWTSVSGKDSLLLWTCGKGYSSWHGTAPGAVFENGTEKIADYMNELDSLHYPYDMVHWRYNIVADNGPVDNSIADFVKAWNEKYRSPRIIIANATDMFQRFEQKYGKVIPVMTGDFTPYWEDGAYSTAREEGDMRVLSEKIILLQNIARQKNIVVNPQWWYLVKRYVILFHEHTWGSWNSISDPDNPFTTHQWKYKKSFTDSAAYFLNRIEHEIRKALSAANKVRVLNTLDWNRSGYVEVVYPAGLEGKRLIDQSGNSILFQKTSEGKLVFMAKDVPARGEKIYTFADPLPMKSGRKRKNDIPIQPAYGFTSPFAIHIDSITGSIHNLRINNQSWVDSQSFSGLGTAIYVNGLNPANHSSTAMKEMQWTEDGPLLRKLQVTAAMEGCNDVVYELRQYANTDYLQWSVVLDKKSIREKESVHIAFPFALADASIRIGTGDQFYQPGKDQLPGANVDFYSVQRWLDVSGHSHGVTVCSPQGALFEVGEMINEERVVHGYKRWKSKAENSGTIFLYAMNNYWHTNYKADQDGKARFDCYLKFHSGFDADETKRFGYEMTQPLTGF